MTIPGLTIDLEADVPVYRQIADDREFGERFQGDRLLQGIDQRGARHARAPVDEHGAGAADSLAAAVAERQGRVLLVPDVLERLHDRVPRLGFMDVGLESRRFVLGRVVLVLPRVVGDFLNVSADELVPLRAGRKDREVGLGRCAELCQCFSLYLSLNLSGQVLVVGNQTATCSLSSFVGILTPVSPPNFSCHRSTDAAPLATIIETCSSA